MYRDTVPFPVYDIHEWWSDKWEAQSYAQDIDWSRPFFDQLKDLWVKVPRTAMMSSNCENSDYCNMANGTKNSYLVMGCVSNENCMYGHIVWKCLECYDCLYCYESQWCYDCIDCVQCYNVAFSRDCDNCSESMFLVHCTNCKNCFGCVGLKNKQYCIFNEQHTKEEYERKVKELNTGNRHTIQFARSRLEDLFGKETVKYYHGFNSQNVTGDYLYNCHNTVESYDLKNSEDVFHCGTGDSIISSQECNFCGTPTLERSFNCLYAQGYEMVCCHSSLNGARLYYCDYCFSCSDCFGCEGLRNKKYCILNKQYTKEEYEALLPKLKEHMKSHGEWGHFSPPAMSPFGYNETIAYEYFPLAKEETLKKGWNWYDEHDDADQKYMGPEMPVPDDVRDATDDITKAIFRCEKSGKLYKILPQELKFYRQMNLPLPRLCFLERQRERFARRNPRVLWNRECANCKKAIQTTYAPERPERVLCEDCFLSAAY